MKSFKDILSKILRQCYQYNFMLLQKVFFFAGFVKRNYKGFYIFGMEFFFEIGLKFYFTLLWFLIVDYGHFNYLKSKDNYPQIFCS